MDSASIPAYRPRLVDASLDELLGQLPGLLVVGARATGKTTTCRRRAATIVSLEREAEAVAFEGDPDAALRTLQEPVLLDEWQAVPGVLGAVRRAVDAEPRPARFLLTGSVRAGLESEIWPATGRLVRVPMYPMSIREVNGNAKGPTIFDRLAEGEELHVPPDPPDLRGYVELALRSGFPEPALKLSGEPRRAWLESFVENLIAHDVMQLETSTTRKRDARRLRGYFEAYALNSAGIADHRTIYEAAGISKVTAVVYEDLLEGLLLAEQVPAWTSNRLKRLSRRPKRYLVDPALVAAALRLDVQGLMRDGTLLGNILDAFVAAQLRPELFPSRTRPRLHHLRTAQGRHEIDLLAELAGERLVAIEVKAGATATREDARHLAWLRDETGDRFLTGLLLHTGPRRFDLDDRIVAAPICALWG